MSIQGDSLRVSRRAKTSCRQPWPRCAIMTGASRCSSSTTVDASLPAGFASYLGCPKNEADRDPGARLAAAGHLRVPPPERRSADRQHLRLHRRRQGGVHRRPAGGRRRRARARRPPGGRRLPGRALPRGAAARAARDRPLLWVSTRAPASRPDRRWRRRAGRTRQREGAGTPPPAAAPVHAYLKIIDGCDRRCAYCAIPLIKGTSRRGRRRGAGRVRAAACRGGARELTLVGQDTSRWRPGRGRRSAASAGRSRAPLGAVLATRTLFAARRRPEALLEALARYAVPYVDLPLQHASGAVLRRMGGRGRAAYLDAPRA